MPHIYDYAYSGSRKCTFKNHTEFTGNNLKVPTHVHSTTFTYKCNVGNTA